MNRSVDLGVAVPNVNMLVLSSSILYDENMDTVRMSEIWKGQTTVFIFLRHFGCISCRAHAVQVWGDRERYEKNGAKIVFISNGDPKYIRFFKDDLNIPDAVIYTDPDLVTFQAVGFKRGFFVALSPTGIGNGIRLYVNGHRQGAADKATGDLWQLGGIVVIKPNGTVAYHYISQTTGDFPPEKDVADKT